MKTLKDLPKDEQLRYLRDQDFKARVEWNSVMGEARRAGLKEGYEQALKKIKKNIALHMLEEKFSVELISEVTGLSEKEIQQISK